MTTEEPSKRPLSSFSVKNRFYPFQNEEEGEGSDSQKQKLDIMKEAEEKERRYYEAQVARLVGEQQD